MSFILLIYKFDKNYTCTKKIDLYLLLVYSKYIHTYVSTHAHTVGS